MSSDKTSSGQALVKQAQGIFPGGLGNAAAVSRGVYVPGASSPAPKPSNPYAGPAGGFRNAIPVETAFSQARPSVPYMQARKDWRGRLYLDGSATQDNIFGGNRAFREAAERQMAATRSKYALQGLSSHKGTTIRHPVILNPGNRQLPYDAHRPVASGDPGRDVRIMSRDAGERPLYNLTRDVIALPQASALRTDMALALPVSKWTGLRRNAYGLTAAEKLYHGDATFYLTNNTAHEAENNLLHEGGHAQTPTAYYRNMPVDDSPGVFARKSRLPGEFNDEHMDALRRTRPFVPGMGGTYDQLPEEFVKSRRLDQNDAQATYGYRMQDANDLLRYHNMHRVYGTDAEWQQAQKNLTQEHAAALGRLRAAAKLRRYREWMELQDREEDVPDLESMPLKPVEEVYRFVDDTDLMKQVRRDGSHGKFDLNKVAALVRLFGA